MLGIRSYKTRDLETGTLAAGKLDLVMKSVFCCVDPGIFCFSPFRILWVMDDGVSRPPVSQVLGAEGKRGYVKSKRYLKN